MFTPSPHNVSISTEMPGPWRLWWDEGKGQTFYVSISTEMPGPWRLQSASSTRTATTSFNLNRDARPLATILDLAQGAAVFEFQSQPRCQAPGDIARIYRWYCVRYVSISTEMPGPWRRSALQLIQMLFLGFNLNRDARPLATGKDGLQGISINYVSISTEMPGPWRQYP